jgi:hypothetical protein
MVPVMLTSALPVLHALPMGDGDSQPSWLPLTTLWTIARTIARTYA